MHDIERCDSLSERETFEFGRRIGLNISAPAVLGLVGELGAGKTVFVRGLCDGLGVPDGVEITSPSYQLLNIYPGGRLTVLHADAYRLKDAFAFDDLDIGDASAAGVLIVEWADRVRESIPDSAVWFRFEHTGPTRRTISRIPCP